MLKVPDNTFAVPPPLPVPTARPAGTDCESAGPLPMPAMPQRGPGPTDRLAIASTVCGLTAFIPIFSQLVGLVLGLWALVRIRRARRAGLTVRGRGWAAAGITGNGFALLGWIALFGAFAALKTNLNETTSRLSPLFQIHPAQHVRVRK